MKRRAFIADAGLGAAAAATTIAAPCHRAERAGGQMAPDLELPEEPGHDLWRGGRRSRNMSRRVTDNKFQIQVFAAGRDRARAWRRPTRCRQGLVEMPATPPATTTGARIRPSPSAPRFPSASTAGMQNAWMYHGGGMELMNEFYARLQPDRLPVRQYRRADGRLVPQGDQVGRRSQRRQDAHRRLRRQGHRQARRGAAADRRRRHLSGAGEGHDRRGRMGRPL